MIIVRMQCASTVSASRAILKNWQASAYHFILRLPMVFSVSQLATASSFSRSLPFPLFLSLYINLIF